MRERNETWRKPHHKFGGSHKPGCGCYPCRVYRRGRSATDALERLAEAERRAAEGTP